MNVVYVANAIARMARGNITGMTDARYAGLKILMVIGLIILRKIQNETN